VTTRSRHLLSWSAVALLAVGAVLASNVFLIRDRLLGSALPAAIEPVTSRVAGSSPQEPPAETSLRSAPWWQTVTTFEGTGSATTLDAFAIRRDASDWRVTWSCTSDDLVVRAEGRSRPLVDADCQMGGGNGEGVGFDTQTGTNSLDVVADGPWRLEVAQRIDLPLVEPLADSMVAPGTSELASGTFYKVDRVAAGNITIYEAADGYAVRLDDFWVTPQGSLQLRLSAAKSPKSSDDYSSSRSQLLASLDVTAGRLNYEAPTGVDPTGFASVVIWSPSDNSVYAAADLEPPT